MKKSANKITDLLEYKDQSHLELCLGLVEEAYQDAQEGHYDMVIEQLRDILEMFDRDECELDSNEPCQVKTVLQFTS